MFTQQVFLISSLELMCAVNFAYEWRIEFVQVRRKIDGFSLLVGETHEKYSLLIRLNEEELALLYHAC